MKTPPNPADHRTANGRPQARAVGFTILRQSGQVARCYRALNSTVGLRFQAAPCRTPKE
jgi:hypothetical protein